MKTDEELLTEIIAAMEGRIEVSSHFLKNPDGLLTHQILKIECGELVTLSEPQEMPIYLRECPDETPARGTVH